MRRASRALAGKENRNRVLTVLTCMLAGFLITTGALASRGGELRPNRNTDMVQLVRDEATLEEARRLFGDEREDYAAALQRNYEQGPPPDWPDRFISTYASSHPAEDFAECWAHFFHIVDTLETGHAFGINLDPEGHEALDADIDFDPYRASNADALVDAWVPLSVALSGMML